MNPPTEIGTTKTKNLEGIGTKVPISVNLLEAKSAMNAVLEQSVKNVDFAAMTFARPALEWVPDFAPKDIPRSRLTIMKTVSWDFRTRQRSKPEKPGMNSKLWGFFRSHEIAA